MYVLTLSEEWLSLSDIVSISPGQKSREQILVFHAAISPTLPMADTDDQSSLVNRDMASESLPRSV